MQSPRWFGHTGHAINESLFGAGRHLLVNVKQKQLLKVNGIIQLDLNHTYICYGTLAFDVPPRRSSLYKVDYKAGDIVVFNNAVSRNADNWYDNNQLQVGIENVIARVRDGVIVGVNNHFIGDPVNVLSGYKDFTVEFIDGFGYRKISASGFDIGPFEPLYGYLRVLAPNQDFPVGHDIVVSEQTPLNNSSQPLQMSSKLTLPKSFFGEGEGYKDYHYVCGGNVLATCDDVGELYPVLDYVLIKLYKRIDQIGSIYVPEEAQKMQTLGNVVAVGPEAKGKVGQVAVFNDATIYHNQYMKSYKERQGGVDEFVMVPEIGYYANSNFNLLGYYE